MRTPITDSALLDLLGAQAGVVCCVGAGGKKSTLYRLAEAHPGRVGLTATAHTEHFPRRFQRDSAVADNPALLAEVTALSKRARVIAFAKPCDLPGRHAGLSFDELAEARAAAEFTLLLVKADGARSRILKAPAPHEPALPPFATTVIPLCSVQAIGAPLDDRIAHRPERVAAIAGLALGEIVQPVHLARLLSSPEGALRGVGAATVVPVINMVDDIALERLAVAVAEAALAATARYDYVVLASMRDATRPIVQVIRR
jgi:probable selenium-dependent hydroxylase accessory protein YqeC